MVGAQVHTLARRSAWAGAVALGLFASSAVAQDAITFVSWGGSTQDAQQEAWAESFTEKTGIRVNQEGPTDYGRIRAQVESGNVDWDVVDVEGEFAMRAARDGLLEELDFDVIDRSKFDERFITDHAAGSFYFSFVLGYNEQSMPNGGPQNWEDFFNVDDYPGQRGVYRWPSAGVLELALLADGVAEEDLYPLDVDRAFDKLEEIEDHLFYWGSGSESQQALASGEISMCMCWNGRVFTLMQEGAPVNYTWNENLAYADFLVIPKGSENREAAMEFIAHATAPEQQARFANLSAFAPVTLEAEELLDSEVRPHLPTHHPDDQVSMSIEFWAEHGPDIADRWNDFITN